MGKLVRPRAWRAKPRRCSVLSPTVADERKQTQVAIGELKRETQVSAMAERIAKLEIAAERSSLRVVGRRGHDETPGTGARRGSPRKALGGGSLGIDLPQGQRPQPTIPAGKILTAYLPLAGAASFGRGKCIAMVTSLPASFSHASAISSHFARSVSAVAASALARASRARSCVSCMALTHRQLPGGKMWTANVTKQLR